MISGSSWFNQAVVGACALSTGSELSFKESPANLVQIVGGISSNFKFNYHV